MPPCCSVALSLLPIWCSNLLPDAYIGRTLDSTLGRSTRWLATKDQLAKSSERFCRLRNILLVSYNALLVTRIPFCDREHTSAQYRAHLCGTTSLPTDNWKLYILAITRSDLSYPLKMISHFMVRPTVEHLRCAQRLLWYVSGTKETRLLS